MLNQQEKKILDTTGVQRYQFITGSLILLLRQCAKCGIICAIYQLARTIDKPSEVHVAAARHLFRYLKRLSDIVMIHKTERFQFKRHYDWG